MKTADNRLVVAAKLIRAGVASGNLESLIGVAEELEAATVIALNEADLEWIWVAVLALRGLPGETPSRDRTIAGLQDVLRKHGWDLPKS